MYQEWKGEERLVSLGVRSSVWREGERISVSCKWEEKETPADPLGVKGGGRMCLLSSVSKRRRETPEHLCSQASEFGMPVLRL